nr:MAG: hypothetical protein [Bacteriophage sp.]
MTTDITELAQSLKAAAVRVIKNYDSEWFEAGHQICTVHKSKINLISLANPVNVLALVEALEKAQAGEKQWREVVDAFCADDADWHKLTNSNNELIALLSQALCKQADRIAELESRTVKLPTTRLWAGVTECYEKSDVIAVIHEAGVGVSDD